MATKYSHLFEGSGLISAAGWLDYDGGNEVNHIEQTGGGLAIVDDGFLGGYNLIYPPEDIDFAIGDEIFADIKILPTIFSFSVALWFAATEDVADGFHDPALVISAQWLNATTARIRAQERWTQAAATIADVAWAEGTTRRLGATIVALDELLVWVEDEGGGNRVELGTLPLVDVTDFVGRNKLGLSLSGAFVPDIFVPAVFSLGVEGTEVADPGCFPTDYTCLSADTVVESPLTGPVPTYSCVSAGNTIVVDDSCIGVGVVTDDSWILGDGSLLGDPGLVLGA